MSHEECLKGSQESEKNPKQILLDWVNDVYVYAVSAKKHLRHKDWHGKYDEIDQVSEDLSNIIGQCTAMKAVLKNSD